MSKPVHDASPSVLLHKRQVFQQILLPVFLAVGLGLAAGLGTIAAGLEKASATRLWADISAIWLILLFLILGLIFLAVVVALCLGLGRLRGVVPRVTSRGQELAGRVEAGTKKIAGGVVKPFLWVLQAGAVIENVIQKGSGSTRSDGKE